MFRKGNNYGIKKTAISAIQQSQIEKLIALGFGYSKISKCVGVSATKIKSLGYVTLNQPYQLKRIKKNSKVNPSYVDSIIDLSDITEKSLLEANKNARVLKFGNRKIKLAIMASRSRVDIKLYNVVSNCGERKEFFADMLLKALELGYKKIGIDTNAKFGDSPLSMFHLVKDYSHPYNQIVESKIGNLKTRIYGNIEKLKQMSINEAIEFIYELASIQFENKVKIEVFNLA